MSNNNTHKNITILNVDDEDAVRYAISRILRQAGFEVIEAANGAEALRLVKKNPDLVILDVNLPDIIGFEVCRRIKADPATSSIPVLHLSATYLDSQSRVKGLEGGADGYLTHPVEPPVLISTVKALLRMRQAETEVLKAANRWNTTFDAINDAIYLMDIEGRILQCNKAMTKLIGKSSDEIIGRACWELIHGTSEPIEGCPFVLMRETRKRETLVLPINDLWFNLAVDPLIGEDGNLIGSIHIISDITESKQIEEELQQSEEKYRNLVERANDGITIIQDEIIKYVNPCLADMRGDTAENIIGTSFTDYIHPDELPKVFDRYKRRVAGEDVTPIYETVLMRKDGSKAYVELNAGVITYQERPADFVIIRDITERKQAEEMLRENEEKYRTLFEYTRDAIITIGPDGRILSTNPASAVMLGYESPEELVGMSATKLYMNPEERKVVLAELMAKGYIQNYEITFVKKDGTPVYVIASSVARKDEKGNIIRIEAFLKDITERKQMEEDLKKSNRRLELALAELRATQQQIIQQERLSALGQMASGIAHDFNNVLTPILGYNEILLTVPEILDDKEKAKRCLNLMKTAIEDARNIISRLREFYRKREEGEIFAPVNINQLVRQAIELTQPKWKNQAQSSGITISMNTDLQKAPLVSGNETELREVLTNLIFNSVDAMPTSGTITIRTYHDTEQGTRTQNGCEHVVIEVSDTGIGMTEEIKQRCFEPFFTTKEERGTGLGLAVIYGIIQRHEGTIEVSSEVGNGTTFIISLPIQIKPKDEEREQKTVVLPRSLHVLVVDDIPTVRDVVIAYLAADGHTFETATNGREGVEKFYKGKFDLVITDRAMPDMNGIQLAGLIKQLSANMPIIMLTGFGEMMKYVGEMPKGVDYLLSKPVRLNDFREALAEVTKL
jgi:PAS domain S-box-containing protein